MSKASRSSSGLKELIAPRLDCKSLFAPSYPAGRVKKRYLLLCTGHLGLTAEET
jgi:hypothetical protein